MKHLNIKWIARGRKKSLQIITPIFFKSFSTANTYQRHQIYQWDRLSCSKGKCNEKTCYAFSKVKISHRDVSSKPDSIMNLETLDSLAGQATDLTVHHHGSAVSLAEAAPATAARGASPHRRARTVSGRALRPHAERPTARGWESRQQKHEFSLQRTQGYRSERAGVQHALLTVCLLCCSLRHCRCCRSSSRGRRPWASGCPACLVSWLGRQWGVGAWARAGARPCPCGPCRGGRREEGASVAAARPGGPARSSWGSARRPRCPCEEPAEPSSPLARHQSGCVCANGTKMSNRAEKFKSYWDSPLRCVPVVRVGLSGVKASEAVGVPVVVGALVHAGVAIGLDLLVAVPVRVVSSPGTWAARRHTTWLVSWCRSIQ